MKNLNTCISIIMAIAISFGSCKKHKDSDSTSPNSCYGQSATGAMFNSNENPTISSGGGNYPNWSYYSSDTVTMQAMNFAALDTSGISYLWTVGGKTYTTKKISIDFSSRPSGQNTIPITLQIKKKSPNECFPSDTGTMTLTKLMFISDTSIVSGNFKGVRTDTLGANPSDSFTVYLNPIYKLIEYDGENHPIDTIHTLVISNLYPSCTNNGPFTNLAIGYKELNFYNLSGANCNGLGGKAMLTPTNDDITIYYGYSEPPMYKSESYIFKGKRIK